MCGTIHAQLAMAAVIMVAWLVGGLQGGWGIPCKRSTLGPTAPGIHPAEGEGTTEGSELGPRTY